MLKKSSVSLTIVFLIGLSGCAGVSHIQLSDKARSEVQTVTINSNIQVNQEILLYGMTQATAGAVGGAVGGLVGEALVADDKTLLKSLIEKNEIKVDRIFYVKLKSQLEESKIFPKVADQSGDAVFNISIASYGLFKKSTFSTGLRAAVWADVSLTRSNGEIIWQKRFKPEMSEDRLPAHALAYYQQHPEILRNGYEMAMEIIAKEIVADLKG